MATTATETGINLPAPVNIEFRRNSAFVLPLIYGAKDEDGNVVPVSLKSGGGAALYGVRMWAKKKGTTAEWLFKAGSEVADQVDGVITLEDDDVTGKIVVTIPDTETVEWERGSYDYDLRIWLLAEPTTTSKYLLAGTLKVDPYVTT